MAKDEGPAGRLPVHEDDRPVRTPRGGLPPELQAPLASFGGVEPPSPQWFKDALAQAPERGFVTSNGSKLELLTWGERGKPGLLFVHGNSAHADWWTFIAPFFAGHYRVAAMSMAGMGASDWRDTYALSDFPGDAEACARAAGLHDAGPPIYVGHSFGGTQVFNAALRHPEQMRAAVLVDTGFGGQPAAGGAEGRNFLTGDRATKVYATLPEALARFRLMPPQPAGELYITDYIARRSLKRAPLPDGEGEGWTWRFDPQMWSKLDQSEIAALIQNGPPASPVPVAHIWGEDSLIVARMRYSEHSFLPADLVDIEIPASHHHIMIDQPLALVAALRALLAVWPA